MYLKVQNYINERILYQRADRGEKMDFFLSLIAFPLF